jgi:2-isopropylmalate synthase
VRVLGSGEGTGATVRVLIESGDGHERWGTVGVSPNVIEASWQALVDSIEYKLYKDRRRQRGKHRSAPVTPPA